jgi:hypothetical protein
MTNNKQTEIDAAELALKLYPFSGDSVRNAFITGYNKAKEMDKEQKINAHIDGQSSWKWGETAEQWYNETYGGGEQ